MRHPAASLAGLLICLTLLLTTSPVSATPVAARESTILVLGDSLSAAYGIAVDAGWVQLLASHLQTAPVNSSDAETRYRVVNASISGETTGGALARLPALLAKFTPHIVIIELGGNDGLQGHPIPRLRDNLAALVQQSQRAGARVLLTGMRIPPNYGKRYTDQFYESYALTAQRFNVPMVPFLLEGVATRQELMQDDGIHPKASAQSIILDNVLPQLEPLL